MVLDTNVLVSALLDPFRTPATILRMIIEGEIQLAFDTRIISEYQRVLQRPKFPFSDEMIEPIIEQIKADGISISSLPLSKTLPDPDDDMFLEVARSANANALITGNKKHFPVRICHPTRIYSPVEFLEFYRQQKKDD